MAVVAHPRIGGKPELELTQTHADVTRDVVATLDPASRGYLMLLGGAVAVFLAGLTTFLVLVKDGLGHAGYNPPIFWSVYITTFVFWVGIGHAGTLISAILFLFRSPWRTAVYRSTEAMTVFAVMTAKTVITSVERYTAVRQGDRNRKRIAEISVPACPMPTQNTKVVM
jgi:hypothetical protein